MEFAKYLANIPLLHTWDGGKTWVTGGFAASHLSGMVSTIRDRFKAPRVIETGAGNSTISFLFTSPERVLSICPQADLFERIIRYCDEHDIEHSVLQTRTEYSQTALPEVLSTSETFDFALIDGAHGWPLVMVDFCYMNAMLRNGALLMIDDVQLHTVTELMHLLDEQPEFRRVADLGKSVIYEKLTDDPYLPEWIGQPYVVRKSAGAGGNSLKRKIRGAFNWLAAR